MKKYETFPTDDGFRMPAEFEKHSSCWIIWPERTDNWRNGAKPAQRQFTDVATAISKFEQVFVGVSSQQYSNARQMLPENIQVIEISNNDAWVRDTGATCVINDKTNEVRGISWGFNAWGGLVDGLYFPWDQDDLVAEKICEINNIDYYKISDFILEGGSIHVDGEGTLYTTEECLLSKGRNSHLSKKEIEKVLSKYLNISKVIWLKRGIYLDETNGHVDNIMNVIKPGIVALAWTDDKTDPQYKISKECLDILENETDAKGRKIEIKKLHVPNPVLLTQEESLGVDAIDGTLPREAGDRQAASYANYYTANNAIIYPLFNDPKDKDAHDFFEKNYPEHSIIGIPAREIILGGGNIHCITQQVPFIKK